MIRLLLFALLFATPVMADDVFMNNTTSESNMCVISVTGQTASTPSAVAHANWSPITYNCAAGTYLPADGIECATCTAGNYCIGGNYTYNETTTQGLTPCTANYTSSAGASTCVPMTYNINYVLNGGSSVPSTYTQLEYLESTGTQYIDTGIGNWNETLEFETKLSIQQQDGGVHTYFGGWDAWNSNGHGIPGVSTHTAYRVGTRFVAGWTFDDGADIGISVGQTGIYSLKEDTISWSLGTSAAFDRGSAFTMNNTNIFLFACNIASSYVGEQSKFKMYYMKIWLNNTMVRNFIPARRNSDGVLGMYDTVTNTFFTNDGTGTFIAGPDMDKYTYGVGATIDSVPNRAHSTFAGWCTDAGLTNCAATQTIGTTATGDKTFYAKYLCDTGYSTNVSNTACSANTITVNWDNGAGGATQNTCTYGGDLTTPTTAPTKRGHVFTGWTFNVN